jgi:hypothetical protein
MLHVPVSAELRAWLEDHAAGIRPETSLAAVVRLALEEYRAKVEKARKR